MRNIYKHFNNSDRPNYNRPNSDRPNSDKYYSDRYLDRNQSKKVPRENKRTNKEENDRDEQIRRKTGVFPRPHRSGVSSGYGGGFGQGGSVGSRGGDRDSELESSYSGAGIVLEEEYQNLTRRRFSSKRLGRPREPFGYDSYADTSDIGGLRGDEGEDFDDDYSRWEGGMPERDYGSSLGGE